VWCQAWGLGSSGIWDLGSGFWVRSDGVLECGMRNAECGMRNAQSAIGNRPGARCARKVSGGTPQTAPGTGVLPEVRSGAQFKHSGRRKIGVMRIRSARFLLTRARVCAYHSHYPHFGCPATRPGGIRCPLVKNPGNGRNTQEKRHLRVRHPIKCPAQEKGGSSESNVRRSPLGCRWVSRESATPETGFRLPGERTGT
jgi:hypothetical protein